MITTEDRIAQASGHEDFKGMLEAAKKDRVKFIIPPYFNQKKLGCDIFMYNLFKDLTNQKFVFRYDEQLDEITIGME